jgi:hypothetical protein
MTVDVMARTITVGNGSDVRRLIDWLAVIVERRDLSVAPPDDARAAAIEPSSTACHTSFPTIGTS